MSGDMLKGHPCEADVLRYLLNTEKARAKRDLARVTAERDAWRRAGEILELDKDKEIATLRARVAELTSQLESIEANRAALVARDVDLEQRNAELEEKYSYIVGENVKLCNENAELVEQLKAYGKYAHDTTLEDCNAELVAALDDLLGCPTVTDRATCPDGDPSRINEAPEWQAVLQISCAWTRYKKLKALARAKSATPAKHPDTEIVDWLEVDPQARLAEVRRLIFIDRDTVREAVHAARKQEASK